MRAAARLGGSVVSNHGHLPALLPSGLPLLQRHILTWCSWQAARLCLVSGWLGGRAALWLHASLVLLLLVVALLLIPIAARELELRWEGVLLGKIPGRAALVALVLWDALHAVARCWCRHCPSSCHGPSPVLCQGTTC